MKQFSGIFPTTLKIIISTKSEPIERIYTIKAYIGNTIIAELSFIYSFVEKRCIIEVFTIDENYSIRAIAPLMMKEHIKFLEQNHTTSTITFKFRNNHIYRKLLQEYGYKITPKENLDFYEQEQRLTRMIRIPKISI